MIDIRKFKKDEGGNIAMMTAILIIPIMSAIGSVIDYTNFVRQKNNIQHSLDAAGLAAGSLITSGGLNDMDDGEKIAAVEELSTQFFLANLKEQVHTDDYVLHVDYIPGDAFNADQIELSVDFTYPTIFGGLVGVDTLENEIAAVISLGDRTVEVALVLDNSGSMGSTPAGADDSKIDTLIEASNSLVDTIFSSAELVTIPDPVKFSLVPFGASVNVGKGNKNANWMDVQGRSSIHHEHFDWDTYRSPHTPEYIGNAVKIDDEFMSRFDVFDMIDVEWTGCVEMRPWPYNVTDDYLNNTSGGDYDKLFVPFFAPDEPDNEYADKYQYYYDYRNYAPATSGSDGVDHDWDNDYYRNSYLYDFRDADGTQLFVNNDSGNPAYGVSGSTRQIERTNWMFKYQADLKIDNYELDDDIDWLHGPNYLCSTRPIVPLSTNKADIKAELDQMRAEGATNIQQGLTWGWRTLTESEPFDEGRPMTDTKNLKVIILLTDGNNWYQQDSGTTPNQSSYGAWGYARDANALKHPISDVDTHNRWAEGLSVADRAGTIYYNASIDTTPEDGADFEMIMNVHTAQACNNIKASGVSIYTVAFDVPDEGGVRQLMEACAGSGVLDGKIVMPLGDFFFDVDGDELIETFEDIAQQISQLRISG